MSASLPRATETGLGRVAQWPRLSPTSPVRALLLSVFKAHLGLQAPGILHLQAGKLRLVSRLALTHSVFFQSPLFL